MSGGQIALLVFVAIFAVLTGLCAAAVPSEAGSAMPISGLLFWFFGIVTMAFAVIFGLTFL